MSYHLQAAINRLPLKGREKEALGLMVADKKDFLSLKRSFLEKFTGRRFRKKNQLISGESLWNAAERECRKSEKEGISVLSLGDSLYPALLKEIYNPPYLIYLKGEISQIPMCAIVGTRHPTSEGAAEAFACAGEQVLAGNCVVSGLALGIDEAAHWGAVSCSGKTVAVLACGLDIVYPWENRSLAERILTDGGSLLSEYPPGTMPDRYRFPERNRIVSGMSSQTILIEAPEKSGALITADFCLEQNRDLLLSARQLDSPLNGGARRLYEDGAPLYHSHTPIVSGLPLMEPENLGRLLEDELSGLAVLYKGSYVYHV